LLVAASSVATLTAQTDTSLTAILDAAIVRTNRNLQAATDIWVDHSRWENAWVAQSPHYEVRTTRSYALGMQTATGLETMLGYFQKTLGIDYTPPQHMKVFLLDELDAYNKLGNETKDTTAGYHQSMYGSYYDKSHPDTPVVALYTDNSVYLSMQITHSAAHQFFDLAFSGTPPVWVDEGLASYFATYWDHDWSVTEFERIRDSASFVPLSTLLADSIDKYGSNAHARFMEMGMLLYYLLHLREDTRTNTAENGGESGPFRDYLLAIMRGRDATTLPAHALTQNLNAVEADFRSYQFPK